MQIFQRITFFFPAETKLCVFFFVCVCVLVGVSVRAQFLLHHLLAVVVVVVVARCHTHTRLYNVYYVSSDATWARNRV